MPPIQDSDVEKLRINKAFLLAVYGILLAAALTVALLIAGWNKASEITSVVGLFTSLVGTVVGAFFGLQIGSAGKAKADERADKAQKKVEALQAASDSDTIARAAKLYPGLFEA